MPQPPTPSWSASLLRRDLSARAHHLARTQQLLHEIAPGSDPTIIFGRDEQGRHGNFHPASDAAICANPAWLHRLTKPHTASRRSRARKDWQWMELDTCNSSDALLMNIFCYPNVLAARTTRLLLGAGLNAEPQFGVKPRTPLHQGKRDVTEIDMELADLLVEAKLTESNFQQSHPRLVHRYRDLEEVFDPADLPLTDGKHTGYQLIRGTLAAHATGKSFCVLLDARRPDLTEAWFRIMRAVRYADLRSRLKLLTWQELASTLPPELQIFLEAKYGICGR